jgi:hypothetical protein
MSGFYDPYSPRPDYAGGFQQILQNLMQIMMMKRMFPGAGGGGQLPQATRESALTSLRPPTTSAMTPDYSRMGPQQIDPRLMKYLVQIMQGGGNLGMPFGTLGSLGTPGF